MKDSIPARVHDDLPPTPPESPPDTDVDDTSSTTNSEHDLPSFPLPPTPRTDLEVLQQDKATPDFHVPRDSRLIRLTGVHPFNTEAPLSDLYDEGFLTSPDLFYVRNHGAVPQVEDAEILDWEFSVEGYVDPNLMRSSAICVSDIRVAWSKTHSSSHFVT